MRRVLVAGLLSSLALGATSTQAATATAAVGDLRPGISSAAGVDQAAPFTARKK